MRMNLKQMIYHFKIIIFLILLSTSSFAQAMPNIPAEVKAVTNVLLDIKPNPKYIYQKKITTSQGLILGGGVLFTAGFIGNGYSLKNDWGGPRVFNPMNPNQLAMALGAMTITIGITITL